MTLHDQMDAAWKMYTPSSVMDSQSKACFNAGFRAALAALANPSDEMVERTIRAIVDCMRTDKSIHDIARACLKAAGGA